MEEKDMETKVACTSALQAVGDALYVLNGKWKLPILIILRRYGNQRFGQIRKLMPKITDRMLSKELRELETNQLVKRIVYDSMPVVVEYSITEYGYSLDPVIKELKYWGIEHRKRIMSDEMVV